MMKKAILLLFFSLHLSADTREIRPVVNDEYLETIIELINSSKKSIRICHFSWNPDTTTDRIKSAVYDAINRGVEVKVILEDSLEQNSRIIRKFSALDIPIRTDAKTEWPRNFLHTKLIIIDSKKVLLGSTNLSFRSINDNNETNVLINLPEIARFYENFFNGIWEKPRTEIDHTPVTTRYVTSTVNRDYFPLMKKRVSEATEKIGMVFYGMRVYPGDENEVMDFIDELVAANKRGVNVRVILEKSSFDKRLNKGNSESIKYLKKREINAKLESPDRITHPKLIIVDDDAVGIGSANFALSGFRFYQEANVIVTEPETINYFWEYFEKLWQDAI